MIELLVLIMVTKWGPPVLLRVLGATEKSVFSIRGSNKVGVEKRFIYLVIKLMCCLSHPNNYKHSIKMHYKTLKQ